MDYAFTGIPVHTIKVKPGLGNKNVDYLSRLDEAVLVDSICDDFPDEHLFAITKIDDPLAHGYTNSPRSCRC